MGFTVDVNQFTDYTTEEYKALLGFKNSTSLVFSSMSKVVLQGSTGTTAVKRTPGPVANTYFDWRDQGAVSPVKD